MKIHHSENIKLVVRFLFLLLIGSSVGVGFGYAFWGLTNPWLIGNAILFFSGLITFIHIMLAALKKVTLHDGGDGFPESTKFTKDAITSLNQHYSRMEGTLLFWKNKAALYGRLHQYAVSWSIVSAMLVPVLIQSFDPLNIWSRVFMTGLPVFSGLLIALSRGFKSEELYRAYRFGESKFYDLRRNLLDIPEDFGKTEEEQIKMYFIKTDEIRRDTRNIEISNPPSANPM